jgi:hypothetical protein
MNQREALPLSAGRPGRNLSGTCDFVQTGRHFGSNRPGVGALTGSEAASTLTA